MNLLECPKAHVIACDLDNSLVAAQSNSQEIRDASDEALREIGRFVAELRMQNVPVYFGSSTGRTFASIQELAKERPAFGEVSRIMNFHITSVGSAIYTRARKDGGFIRTTRWPRPDSWNRNEAAAQLSAHPDLVLQEPAAQDAYKLSYIATSYLDNAAQANQLHAFLAEADLEANVIVSGSGPLQFVDVLPPRVDKGTALLQLPRLLNDIDTPEESICRVAIGDSMNDQAALAAADVSIIPGNGQPDLLNWATESLPSGSFYVTDEYFAAGVLQGLRQHLCPA